MIRRIRGDDAGTTIVELAVTMLIMSIVAVATLTLVIGFERSNAQNMARQDQIDEVRTAVLHVSTTLRSAVAPSQLPECSDGSCPDDAFIEASGYLMRFYANLDNPDGSVGPSRVEYYLDGTTLMQAVQVPDSAVPGPSGFQYCDARADGASAACAARLTEMPLAFNVVQDASTPLFSYYKQGAVEMVPASGGSLTAAELANVLSVDVHVVSQVAQAEKADPTEVVQRVTLPNSQILIRQNEEDS